MAVAVVTGASSGIGAAYSRHLARSGHDLILAARGAEGLAAMADELATTHGVDVRQVPVDLASPDGVAELIERSRGAEVVVANAGATIAGRTGTVPWDELGRLSYLLGPGVAQLCDGLVPGMVERGSGRVAIVASIGALVPMPKSAVYAAAKAYAVSYARSLNAEVEAGGVRVCAVCPGYVRTPLHQRAGLDHLTDRLPGWLWIEPEQVVTAAESGLDRGRDVVVPGAVYRAARPFLQSSLAAATWRRMTARR
ncbi:MAG: SDR family NAD(P)-dependent oxidoreductase [Actinomycetota bacterium]